MDRSSIDLAASGQQPPLSTLAASSGLERPDSSDTLEKRRGGGGHGSSSSGSSSSSSSGSSGGRSGGSRSGGGGNTSTASLRVRSLPTWTLLLLALAVGLMTTGAMASSIPALQESPAVDMTHTKSLSTPNSIASAAISSPHTIGSFEEKSLVLINNGAAKNKEHLGIIRYPTMMAFWGLFFVLSSLTPASSTNAANGTCTTHWGAAIGC